MIHVYFTLKSPSHFFHVSYDLMLDPVRVFRHYSRFFFAITLLVLEVLDILPLDIISDDLLNVILLQEAGNLVENLKNFYVGVYFRL